MIYYKAHNYYYCICIKLYSKSAIKMITTILNYVLFIFILNIYKENGMFLNYLKTLLLR